MVSCWQVYLYGLWATAPYPRTNVKCENTSCDIMQLLFFLCSDPEAVLKKVQKIEELIATIEGLAKETEVGAVDIVHPVNTQQGSYNYELPPTVK